MDVKICGLTRRDDALAALESGADFLGFVLYSKSPRCVTPLALAKLLDGLGAEARRRAVAVVVNMPAAEVASVAGDCGLAAVQFHGDEAPAAGDGLPCAVWRAVCRRADAWKPEPGAWPAAERYVVDAFAPETYGGSGRLADWKEAGRLARRSRVMLSGGLTPLNVAEAVRAVKPAGVDVSSGVESEPGRKDHEAVRRFIAEARRAE